MLYHTRGWLFRKGKQMPNKNESVEKAKKTIETEVKGLAKKTKKTLDEAKDLRKQKADAEKQKDKKRVVDLQKSLKNIEKDYLKEADTVSKRLQKDLKDFELPKKDERGFAKWYADIVDKESGIDLGKDIKLWGDVDFKKKKFELILKGTF
jgi:exonuclease VII large subunit